MPKAFYDWLSDCGYQDQDFPYGVHDSKYAELYELWLEENGD